MIIDLLILKNIKVEGSIKYMNLTFLAWFCGIGSFLFLLVFDLIFALRYNYFGLASRFEMNWRIFQRSI